jgi:hypothetical protein
MASAGAAVGGGAHVLGLYRLKCDAEQQMR